MKIKSIKTGSIIKMNEEIKDDESLYCHLQVWSDLQLKILSYLSDISQRSIINTTMTNDEFLRFCKSQAKITDFFFDKLTAMADKEHKYTN